MKYQFKNVRGLKKTKPEEVIKVEADENYSVFYFSDGRNITLAKTLKECEGIFEPYPFFRTHRSCMINLLYCIEIHQKEVILINNLKANISRRRLTGLKNSLLYLKNMT
ncbi:MAG: LytTR family transcriptional regulator [Cytophagaceae bacterium]|nr:LytTR family transcriptional regulator [Cytophagaceae bacterium]MBK9934827.1 LytTR family transcriptional regulator [Cytophagaceae bacterium]MBL0301263.1 LytTR family transcriptional regulator [Cytophagaceae bacterium]MBL0324080.1 LytTR family transcriptional regulator [Cytophagaceae bacterium]